MNRYLVLYRSPIATREMMAQGTPEQRRAGMEAWMAWAARAGSAVVDLGAPLGDGARLGGGTASAGFLGGYSILQAESLAAAERVLAGHPHLHVPGASIEVLEAVAMPGR